MDKLSQEKLAEILIKDPTTLGELEKSFLRARRSYLTAEDEKKFASVLDEAKVEEVSEVKPKKKTKKA